MHILIDASRLRHATAEATAYFRETARRLLLSEDLHAYTFVGWPGQRLGRLADFLAPLSRIACSKLLAVAPAGETAVIYSPIGMPAKCLDALAPLLRGALSFTVGTLIDEAPRRPPAAADFVVTLTRSAEEAAVGSGLSAERIRCIPPGIEASSARWSSSSEVPLPESDYGVISGARCGSSLSAARAVWRSFAAFRELRRRTGRDLELVVLDGAPRCLKKVARGLGLTRRVRFLSTRGQNGDFERARVLASAKVYVHASRADASWLSAAAAMRHGVPILAPRSRASREVFGDVALYYAEGNASEMADELTRLFESGELRRSLARHGMLRGQSYSWEGSVRQLLGLFDEISDLAAFAQETVGGAVRSGYNRALSTHAQTRRGNLQ